MTVNMLALLIFCGCAVILACVGIPLWLHGPKVLRRCTAQTEGTVCRYTIAQYNGVSEPIFRYFVDGTAYERRLCHTGAVYFTAPWLPVKSEISDPMQTSLRVKSNSYVNVISLTEQMPVGTRLPVFYDPQKPKRSYVARYAPQARTAALVLTLTAAFLLALGVVLFLALPAKPL